MLSQDPNRGYAALPNVPGASPKSTATRYVANAALVVGALAIVALASLLADRVAGRYVVQRPLPNSVEVTFPPGSEVAFRTVEFAYDVHINSFGYRDEEPSAIPAGAYRIMAIGDSFTYGYGVNVEDTWVKRLEAHLRHAGLNVSTLNLGRPGSAVSDYVNIAERAIPLLQPNLVIVAMLQSDDMTTDIPKSATPGHGMYGVAQRIWPNLVQLIRDRSGKQAELTPEAPVHPPSRSTAEEARQAQARAARETLDEMTPDQRARYDRLADDVKQHFLDGDLNPFLINIATQYPGSFREAGRDLPDYSSYPSVEPTAVCLRRIRDVAATVGARVLVLAVPLGAYVNEHALAGYARVGYTTDPEMLAACAPDRLIQAASEAAGLPFYTVTDGFRARRGDPGLYYPLDGHFTPAGHALFAELVAPIVQDKIAK